MSIYDREKLISLENRLRGFFFLLLWRKIETPKYACSKVLRLGKQIHLFLLIS